ncbi:MAG: hypothetical protein HS124_06830 [Anaerolineales bacterium]|nr:hypothetical protein [Anaerolineales bacterium]
MPENVPLWLVQNDSRPTVCVTCVWAGVEKAWEQEKLEARKMLENAAESHTSGAPTKKRASFDTEETVER